MKLRTGKEKITEWQGRSVLIDWDDFLHYQGSMHTLSRVEKAGGQVLTSLGLVLVIGSFVLALLTGELTRFNLISPSKLVEVTVWVGAALALYGWYLMRDRNQFAFNLDNPSLQELALHTKQDGFQIELENYFNYYLWSLLDKLYFQADEYFLVNLINSLWDLPATDELVVRLGVDKHEFKGRIETELRMVNTSFSAHYLWLFAGIFNKAIKLGLNQIDERAVVVVMAETIWKKVLMDLDVTADHVAAMEMWLGNQLRKENYRRIWRRKSLLKPTGTVNRAYTSRYAPTLQQFGEDYTYKAASGDFTLTIGREPEMQNTINVLQKQNGAAVIIVGDPGVGKTQFLKHLGVRMVVEDVPKALQDQRLVAFNFTKAFAQNQSFESFKLTLQNIIDEVAKSKDIILILDDMDQLLNVRADLQAEIVNLLVTGINNHNLRLVGTASVDGYNRFIKPIRPLAVLFQPLMMAEAAPLISLQILIDEIPDMEARYGVKIQIKALRQIVELAPKFAYERVMPDKAIDLLEEAMLQARDSGARYLTADIVSDVVSAKVGAKVGNLSTAEAQVLTNLENIMHQKVVGQDSAITAVAAALRRSRAGLKAGSKPVASFLFFGPTGVGKTEVAKTLAAVYYGDEKLMIRIDMSEYQEEANLERLIGSVEGGKFVAGYLTEAVRTKPFSLILLDEIEKANPKVLDLFLQILDEGFLTDTSGRKIDFSNTIIIATSNAGSREIAAFISNGEKYDQVYPKVLPLLQQVFRLEFLNRFDKIIMFKPLLQIEVQQIADKMLSQINHNLMEKGMQVQYTEHVIAELAERGYSTLYGAREVRRVIQEEIEDKIASLLIEGKLKPGGKIIFESLDTFRTT